MIRQTWQIDNAEAADKVIINDESCLAGEHICMSGESSAGAFSNGAA